MKILVNSRSLTQKITGTQRFAIEISLQLRKLLPNAVFVSPKNVLHAKIADELNVKTIGVNTGHLWEQIDLPLYLKFHRTPLLLNLMNTAPLVHQNKIISILDLSFLEYPDWFSRKFRLFYKFLVPRVAHQAKKIITISYFSRKRIENLLNINTKKIEVIYCGISHKFKLNPTARKENFILAVSSLDPRKNFKNLILAFKKLGLKDHKLLIVGSKNKVFSNTEIQKLIKETSNIEFTGYVSDEELVRLYQKARLFVYPSLYEGFGLPPLEAMACGTPVVVSNVASLPEVCGDAAYYVNPYDVNDIARGIETVLKDELLQKELIQKGLKRVKLFSWERSAKKLLKIIEEVL